MSQHIYTYDPANDQLNEIGGAGHIIKDESGTSFTKRENLQFNGMTVTDDATSNSTIVEPIETNFVGTWAQWQALTLAERAQYETVDLLDDFNGAPIDPTPAKDSVNAVQSGGVYDALDPMLNVLGAKNLCPNNYITQVLHGLTITVKDNGEVWVSGSIESGTNSVSMQINNGLPRGNEALILTGCPANGGEGSYRIMAVLDNDTRYYDNGNGVTIPANSSISRVNIVIYRNNGQVYDLKFKPMIRLASIEDDTYAPYSRTNQELAGEVEPMLNVLGAKNLLPNNATSQTVSGVTFTVNSDGSITAQGTPQATISYVIDETFVGEVGKKYTLTGCPSGGSNTTYCLASYLYGIPYDARDIGAGANFTVVGGKIQTRIIIYTEAGSINLTFKPMIRPVSIQDDTYVPYAMTNRELTEHVNGLVVEAVTSNSITIAANSNTTVYATITKSGYTPIGIMGIRSFSSELTPYEWSISDGKSQAYVGVKNRSSSSVTGALTFNILYKKS